MAPVQPGALDDFQADVVGQALDRGRPTGDAAGQPMRIWALTSTKLRTYGLAFGDPANADGRDWRQAPCQGWRRPARQRGIALARTGGARDRLERRR